MGPDPRPGLLGRFNDSIWYNCWHLHGVGATLMMVIYASRVPHRIASDLMLFIDDIFPFVLLLRHLDCLMKPLKNRRRQMTSLLLDTIIVRRRLALAPCSWPTLFDGPVTFPCLAFYLFHFFMLFIFSNISGRAQNQGWSSREGEATKAPRMAPGWR
jgi:hypothetical protein